MENQALSLDVSDDHPFRQVPDSTTMMARTSTKRPRVHYSVRALFLLLSAAAFLVMLGRWIAATNDVRRARKNYERVFAEYEAGMARPTSVSEASVNWLNAELRRPRAKRRVAYVEHVARLHDLERHMRKLIPFTTYTSAGIQDVQRQLTMVVETRLNAEQEIAHADRKSNR